METIILSHTNHRRGGAEKLEHQRDPRQPLPCIVQSVSPCWTVPYRCGNENTRANLRLP